MDNTDITEDYTSADMVNDILTETAKVAASVLAGYVVLGVTSLTIMKIKSIRDARAAKKLESIED